MQTAQGSGIGISLQASQVLENTIVPEQLSSFDPSQAKNHRIHESEEQSATTVAIVALGQSDLFPSLVSTRFVSETDAGGTQRHIYGISSQHPTFELDLVED